MDASAREASSRATGHRTTRRSDQPDVSKDPTAESRLPQPYPLSGRLSAEGAHLGATSTAFDDGRPEWGPEPSNAGAPALEMEGCGRWWGEMVDFGWIGGT